MGGAGGLATRAVGKVVLCGHKRRHSAAPAASLTTVTGASLPSHGMLSSGGTGGSARMSHDEAQQQARLIHHKAVGSLYGTSPPAAIVGFWS